MLYHFKPIIKKLIWGEEKWVLSAKGIKLDVSDDDEEGKTLRSTEEITNNLKAIKTSAEVAKIANFGDKIKIICKK